MKKNHYLIIILLNCLIIFNKNYIEEKGDILISLEYINSKTKLDIQCICTVIYTHSFDKFKKR
jgi:hypothetical protein